MGCDNFPRDTIDVNPDATCHHRVCSLCAPRIQQYTVECLIEGGGGGELINFGFFFIEFSKYLKRIHTRFLDNDR